MYILNQFKQTQKVLKSIIMYFFALFWITFKNVHKKQLISCSFHSMKPDK